MLGKVGGSGESNLKTNALLFPRPPDFGQFDHRDSRAGRPRQKPVRIVFFASGKETPRMAHELN
jgi:hypothetical protein